MIEGNEAALSVYNMSQVNGVKRLIDETSNYASMKSINTGWNSPQNGTTGPPLWSPPPPSLPLPPNLPYAVPSYNAITNLHDNRIDDSHRVKVEECGFHTSDDGDHRGSFNTNMELQDGVTTGPGLDSK